MAFSRSDSIGDPSKIIIPDQISPIYAWRGWKYQNGNLCAIGTHCLKRNKVWPHREELNAECLHFYRKCKKESPNRYCDCGIYSAKSFSYSYEYAQTWYRRGFLNVYGSVALSGRVIQHKLGYRAQKAYPKHLFISESVNGIDSELIAAILRANYGCQVDIVKTWRNIPKHFDVKTVLTSGIAAPLEATKELSN